MIQLQLMQNCDHKVTSRETKVISKTLTKEDTMSQDIGVQNILAVGSLSCLDTILSPEIYTVFNGKLVWLRSDVGTDKYRIPLPGEEMNLTLKYMDADLTIYQDFNCPRCCGTGWYINPIQDGRPIKTVTGSLVVAQEFVKSLLTPPGTNRLDPGFGAGLILESGVHYFDSNLEGKIRSAIITAEEQCKTMAAKRTVQNDDEVLGSAELDDIVIDQSTGRMYLSIKLTTVLGSKIKFSLTV